MGGPPPRLEDVLANTRRGRVVYVVLTSEQKRALRDPQGRIALDVLRHLLGARPKGAPERFPLAEQAFQAVALKLGYVVGQKRCRRMVARLVRAKVIGRAGQYRQPYRNGPARSGFRVASTGWPEESAQPTLLSESVLSATGRLSRGIFGLAGGSTRSWGTFWAFRHRRYPVPRRGAMKSPDEVFESPR